MKSSIQILCSAVKKIISELKPQANGLSFLIITGKTLQGRKTLLRQSHFKHIIAEGEVSTDIYYNQHGIIIDLSESWLSQSKQLLQQTLKQLNRCHHHINITGLLLCVDINELTPTDPVELSKNIQAHHELAQRFSINLGYTLNIAIIVTKLDTLAGFCEFYQQEHETELANPLGFSLIESQDKDKLEKNFSIQFNRFIEFLSQQILNKVHPARSSIKRTLIREFPLQLASIEKGIQSLVLSFSPKIFRLHALFFTSGEQGGFSQDQLNKKIQHEYALILQDKFPLSNNHRAYFIQGALLSFQLQTKQYGFEKPVLPVKSASVFASAALVAILALGYSHYHSNQLLDKASKEWLAFDAAANKPHTEVSALNHMNTATAILDSMKRNILVHGSVNELKAQLNTDKTTYLRDIFLPHIIKEVENVLTDNQQPHGIRYQALKIYLMLGNTKRYQPEAIAAWYRAQAAKGFSEPALNEKLSLIDEAIKLVSQKPQIDMHIVSDSRNYLNSLPVSYLYYSIAKNNFSTEKQPIDIKGFALADTLLPYYFTKAGFHNIIQQCPQIAKQLSSESWVLDTQVPDSLPAILEQAYSYDYALWWKNFIKKTTPLRALNYQDAIHLTQTLRQSNSIERLITLIQAHTSPELGDASNQFNQLIASQFTDVNLVNSTSISSLIPTLNEMEKFLTTMSIVNDQGKTAFTITKSRFQGDTLTNPLSLLFNQSEQLPPPVSDWTKQVANDAWFILVNDTKYYINTQWKNTVYRKYTASIAKRYPFDQLSDNEVSLEDFNHFFATHGILNTFAEEYLKPFLDTSIAEWKPKELNGFVLPISKDTINEIIRANVITNMFFGYKNNESHIEFTLQKSDLDPVVSSLFLKVGEKTINDTQSNASFTRFEWPQPDAKLTINTLEGKTFSLDEHGVWAFFKLLQKVDVQADNEDSSRLQVLFEVNGNSGRYLLKTQNEINPFTPGILNGFNLNESIG